MTNHTNMIVWKNDNPAFRILIGVTLICFTLALNSAKSNDSVLGKKKSHERHRVHNRRIDPDTGIPRIIHNLNFSIKGIDDHKIIADSYLQHHLKGLNKKKSANSNLKKFSIHATSAGTTLRYYQDFNGIEVYNSDVAITVNKKNAVSFVSIDYKPDIKLSTITPTIDSGDAINAAMKEMDVNQKQISFVDSKLVVYVDNSATTYLAWCVRVTAIKKKMVSYEFLYDSVTGENLHIKSLIFDKSSTGRPYQGSHNARKSPNAEVADQGSKQRYMRGTKKMNTIGKTIVDLLEAFVVLVHMETTDTRITVDGYGGVFDPNPLATAQAKYNDPGYMDNLDHSTPQLEAQILNKTLHNITFDGKVYKLVGPYAYLEDFDVPFTCLLPTVSESTNFYRTRDDRLFNAVNAYYHIDAMMRYIEVILDIRVGPTLYEGGVHFDPHANNGEDNSYYNFASQQLGYGEGGVDDTEDAEVIIHELGHGLHDWLTAGSVSRREGLSEGFSDYLAASYSRSKKQWTPEDPEYFWLFPWDGHNEFWNGRIINYEKKYPDGLTNDDHNDGQIWSTCNMRIWDAIGKEASDKIQLIGLSYTSRNSNQDDLANAVITAARDLDYSMSTIAQLIEIYTACGYDVSCGNDVLDGKEECDGNDIGNATCMDRGCSAGTPKCRSSCHLDYSSCEPVENQSLLELKLMFDKYPDENKWDVRDHNDIILFSGADYSVSEVTIYERMCLKDDCYTISIFDTLGDGMCCDYGSGGLELIYDSSVVLNTNFTSGRSIIQKVGTCSHM